MSAEPKLVVRIFGDNSNLQKTLNATQRSLKNAFGAPVMKASANLLKGMSLLTIAAGALGGKCILMSGQLAMTQRAFETLTGSVEAAQKHISELERFAAKTPFQFKDLAKSSKMLQAYGFNVKQVIPMMRTLGDATMAVGLGQDGLNRIILALGQMKAKGRVSGEEMRQLAETGLPIWEMMAKQIGITTEKLRGLTKKGVVSAEAGIAMMLREMSERYGGMMGKMEKEIPQGLSNLQDNVESIMRSIGRDITDAFDLKDKLAWLNDKLLDFATNVRALGIAGMFEDMGVGIKTAIVGIASTIALILIPHLAKLGVAITATLAPLAPFIVAGALAAGGYALYKAATDDTGPRTPQPRGSKGRGQKGTRGGGKTGTRASTSDVKAEVEESYDVAKQTARWEAERIQRQEDADFNSRKLANKRAAEQVAEEKRVADLVKATQERIAALESKGADRVAKAQKDAHDRMVDDAKRASSSIEDMWNYQMGNRGAALKKWYNEELEALNKSKSVNENYQVDLNRLETVYAERRKEIAREEARERIKTFKTVQEGYDSIRTGLKGESFIGSESALFDMAEKLKSNKEGIFNFFEEVQNEFSSSTEKGRQDIIDALTSAGIEFKRTAEDVLDFTSEKEERALEAFKNFTDERKRYYESAQNVMDDIDAARHERSMELLMERVSAEEYAQLSLANSAQQLMETYIQLQEWAAMTTQEIWANVTNAFAMGLPDAITNMVMDIENAEDAMKAFGKQIVSVIIKSFAQMAVGKLLSAKVGIEALKAETLASAAAAKAIAKAWAKAAANVSLATFGSNAAAAAAGIKMVHQLTEGLSKVSAIPGFAKGGVITGPVLGMVGEGRYNEAILPLSNKTYDMFARAIQKKSEDTGRVDNSVTNVNIYGDINDAGDEGRVFEALFKDTGFAFMGG